MIESIAGTASRRIAILKNKVALGFVEDDQQQIRVIQRRAYGLHDEEYLMLKILTSGLPSALKSPKSPTKNPRRASFEHFVK